MGLSTAVGDEGGFAPMLPSQRGGARRGDAGDRGGGLPAGHRTSAIALDVAASELYQDGEYVFKKGDGSRRPAAGDGGRSTPSGCDRYPIVSIEDGLAEDDWDGLGAADRAAATSACSWSATTSSCTNVDRLGARHRGGRRQRDPGQGEPDRHAHRDAAVHRAGQGERVRRDHLAPLGRDRGHLHRRPRGGHRARGRSRPAAPAAPTARPSTTSCSGSPRSWASWRTTRGGTSTRCDAGALGIASAGRSSLAARLRAAGRGVQHAGLARAPAAEAARSAARGQRAAAGGGLARAGGQSHRAGSAGAGAGGAGAVRDDPEGGVPVSRAAARGALTGPGARRALAA